MRDQYAGDVSDVIKFALLRALAGTLAGTVIDPDAELTSRAQAFAAALAFFPRFARNWSA